MRCSRCRNGRTTLTTSAFTHEIVCTSCYRSEQQHPMFDRAEKANIEALWAGDLDYHGIGLPSDLVVHQESAA